MRYLIGIIVLFSISFSAVNNNTNNKTIEIVNNTNETIAKINKKKGTVDISNHNNPVARFCKANGGTYVPDKQICSLPNNINYDALDYWSYGMDQWDNTDQDFFCRSFNNEF